MKGRIESIREKKGGGWKVWKHKRKGMVWWKEKGRIECVLAKKGWDRKYNGKNVVMEI